jgi:glucose-6-phosphate isomerase
MATLSSDSTSRSASTTPWVRLAAENLFDTAVGPNGLTESEVAALRPRLEAAHASIHASVASGELPFLRLHEDTVTLDRIKALAADHRKRFDDLVVLGIGGSSLGGRALITALGGSGSRVHFPDNLDPDRFSALMAGLDLDRTVFNAISKSGTTLETLSQLLIVRDRIIARLGQPAIAPRLVVTTDPVVGFLRRLATQEGLVALDVPPGVGGRFSVFTPVGLYPAAVAGVDLDRLMAGVAWAAEQLASADPAQNPALAAAGLFYLFEHDHGRPILTTAPYADALRPTGEWFSQLWAESLGKGGRGPTPVTAVGATDQHSQLQLWMEGPPNNVISFIEVAKFSTSLAIPPADLGHEPELAYMIGHDMGHILRTEKRGTERALTEAGRPNLTWHLPEITPESLGALLLFWEAMTAYAGRLYGIDPFDQPGVEAGKKIAKKLLHESKP